MAWQVYLSGEIHSDWRERIERARATPGSTSPSRPPSPTTRRPTTAASRSSATRTSAFWKDHKGAGVNAIRTRTLLERADVVVVRFGEQYKQWNAAFDAGYAAALGKPLVTLHPEQHDHALKEVDRAALAVAREPEQVVEILRYVLRGELPRQAHAGEHLRVLEDVVDHRGVSTPVNVFCWLGWKQPSMRPAAARRSRRRGRTSASGAAAVSSRRSAASQANCAEADHHARVGSSASSGRAQVAMHVSRSAGVGLFAGGAQRTAAVIHVSVSSSPSSRCTDVGWFARPARCSAANRKSPERSPVKMRPVRLPPCAAGARPKTTMRASGSPKPGIGRPQYSSPRVRGALDAAATSSRHATSRGQRRQSTTAASSAARAPSLTTRSPRAGRR